MTYTIERVKSIDDVDGALAAFFEDEAENLSRLQGDKFNWRNFDFLSYARHGLFWICRKDGQPVGVMMARLYASVFDHDTKILFQDILYVKASGGRAAHLLFSHFVDFGKANANHIFTSITKNTNIKARSLEKFGFEKIEDTFRMEC